MKVNQKNMRPVFFIIIYTIYWFCISKLFYKNGLIIRFENITASNIIIKLLYDFLSSLLIVIIIISSKLIKKQPLSKIGITKNNSTLAFILLSIYIGMFFIKGDFSLIGIYKSFFYLIIVSLSEELIFRGYLFTELDREFPTHVAIIISGIMWGIMHALIPIIIKEASFIQAISAIISEIGFGVVCGGIFALIYKKSKSLIISIMIHAILDFSSIFIS